MRRHSGDCASCARPQNRSIGGQDHDAENLRLCRISTVPSTCRKSPQSSPLQTHLRPPSWPLFTDNLSTNVCRCIHGDTHPCATIQLYVCVKTCVGCRRATAVHTRKETTVDFSTPLLLNLFYSEDFWISSEGHISYGKPEPPPACLSPPHACLSLQYGLLS